MRSSRSYFSREVVETNIPVVSPNYAHTVSFAYLLGHEVLIVEQYKTQAGWKSGHSLFILGHHLLI